MKKLIAVSLTALIVFAVVAFFPTAVAAHDMQHCYNDYEICRANAFSNSMNVVKTTFALTVCDIALGKCILAK